ncbi:MAG: hypothetical protein K0S35_1975 [Geminicoccaceae bacterium]|nr:hypothetical protein [Geminicoccaceae bacterium]
MLIDVVRQLGAEADERWAREDYALEAFASIAADAIERFSVHDLFDLAEFADWLTETEDLPEQHHAKNTFGVPRITVWRSSRFFVDMYFWTTPETTLHDHGFAGAFTNLLGESLHCVYRLGSVDEPEPGVLVTDLDLQAVEMLDRGSIRPILNGRQFVHRVTHLSRPTVTLVVRTAGARSALQYTYSYPSIGIEQRRQADEQDQLLQKRRGFLSFLAMTGNPHLEVYVKQLVDQSDAREALGYVLRLNTDAGMDPLEHFSLLNRFLEHLEVRYGPWIDKFGSALLYQIKESRVNWHRIQDVDQRFLAAMLLALPSRTEVIETIRKYRDPTSPAGWLIEHLQSMIEAEGLAVVINDFQFSVLRDLILGRPEAEVVEAALAGEGHGQSAGDLRDLCAALRQIDIFQPLFAADSGHRGGLSWSGS